MQCGENSTQTAHTFVHISHTPGGPRFAHINGPLGEHTQSAQGRVQVSDALNSGKVIRLLTIVDECTRNLRPSRSTARWVNSECAGCWIGSRLSEDY
jgi:hypothetical protein